MVGRDLLVARVAVVVGGSLDLGERLDATVVLDLPGGKGMALVEDILDLLEGAALSLGEHEEDVDEPGSVECREQKVGLVRLETHSTVSIRDIFILAGADLRCWQSREEQPMQAQS